MENEVMFGTSNERKVELIPLQPQPTLGADGIWRWKDCQWMDGGLGFPRSGIEDHSPYRKGDCLSGDDGHSIVTDVSVGQFLGEMWMWAVTCERTFKPVADVIARKAMMLCADLLYMDGPWRNDACKGYAIMAMQRAGLDEETIRKVSSQMTWCFDDTTVEEAARFYQKGSVS